MTMKPKNAEERVDWIYNSQSNDELAERYAEWAKSYEQDMSQGFDYRSPQFIADYLSRFVSKEGMILDAGAGTGMVGELLYQRGFQNLVAMDLSEGMLSEARKKSVYADLQVGILGQPLDFPTDAFEAVVSAGVFTLGHAPASGFDELIRVTKPGGHIIFTLHSDLYEGTSGKGREFPDKLAALEQSGAWSLLERSDRLQSTPLNEPEVTIRVLVYRITK
ncbi:MAG: class I SAM-dependent methyltransferase [Chloroflexota bacterium]